VGALIVDSGKEGVPISGEDFEYLKVIGELIGAAVGKAELSEQLTESYRKKEAMVKQTADAFRNRITIIGTNFPKNSPIGQGSGFGSGCQDTLSGNRISGAPFGEV